MSGPSYLPLRNHSAYSLLEGAIPVTTLVKRAKELNLPALALTDTGNLFGGMEFSLACAKEGIQPILGCQIPLVLPRPHQEMGKRPAPFHLPLYVQNKVGYRNLCRLLTMMTVDQKPEYQGTVTWDQLDSHTEGLIALSGGEHGLLNQKLLHRLKDEAQTLLKELIALFPDRLYIEISRIGAPDEERIEEQLIAWAYENNLPLVATNDAYFLDPEMATAHDALLCIAEGTYVQEEERRRVHKDNFFKTPAMMEDLFKDLPEALENTLNLARRCSFMLETSKPSLPSYPMTQGKTEEKILREKAKAALEARLVSHVFQNNASDQGKEAQRTLYHNRLNYELDVIIQMGFAGYFLIVADFIGWAKAQKIPVGPGRGSGASSLVAWALGITDVDPIRFKLLFERFLNPERVSMPDFDVDFCQERRDEVIDYVRTTYGRDRVAHIITFGKLQARAVLRDVGRVLQMPYGQVDRICKLVPFNPAHPVTLAEAIQQEPQLQDMQREDPQVARLLALGQQLEGLYRHASTHAAGVVIGQGPLTETLPLYQDPRSPLPATQFSMHHAEAAGLVKFDFLGLKTLSIIQETLRLLEQRGIKLNISTIPLDDPATFEFLRRVETVGIFQVESGGMTDVLRRLQPERFEEIIALVALYRPGPMDDIPRYIACRHGKEKVTYPYDCLKEILKETFGVMVYQEQVLQIAQVLAGYSLGGADLLRRAMGKKIPKEMEAQRQIFVEGVLKNHGGERTQASQLFDQIAKFAGYAFPKAHAAPYALITYQTAYLKANYPVEFMAASLSFDIHNTDKIATLIREVKRMGIPVFPPSVNHSGPFFQVEQGETGLGIRYALGALKNVGEGAMAEVQKEQTHRAFDSIFDFVERLGSRGANKKQLEALIHAGAFDALYTNRQQLALSVETLVRHGSSASPTLTLFSVQETRPPLVETQDFSLIERLRHEFQAVGFYLSHHPLNLYEEALSSSHCLNSSELHAAPDGQTFSMAGVLITKSEKQSKTGNKYAFLNLSDAHGAYDVTVFSELLSEIRDILTPGQLLYLTLTSRKDGEQIRLTAQKIVPLNKRLGERFRHLLLKIREPYAFKDLHQVLSNAPAGQSKISVAVHLPDLPSDNQGMDALFSLPQTVEWSPDLTTTVSAIPGVSVEEQQDEAA